MDVSLWTLWAKSDAGGRSHSLIGHLLDAGAVAELIWDEFLAHQTQQILDQATDGHGRDVFVLACALHDIGKATPAFQVKDDELWAAVQIAGFNGHPGRAEQVHRQHWRAGAYFLHAWLPAQGARGLGWLAPVIEGHHGWHEEPVVWFRPQPRGDGDARWLDARSTIATFVAAEFGIAVGSLVSDAPTLGTQLALAGHLVMADWIASSNHFSGLAARPATAAEARQRASVAWRRLGFAPGWASDRLDCVNPLSRFPGRTPRPLQTVGVEVARSMSGPGLVIVEAPMGDGKTEAGLAMAEVLAARNGCNGLLFAMPTQGTTDAMYTRVAGWAAAVDPSVPVSLLHGKAMLNEAWRKVIDGVAATDDDLDELGMTRIYGEDPVGLSAQDPIPPEWIRGRHRGLLAHVGVATIDQVLFAATRTKFVSLRHAGLAGKVLIIDEVHTYDVFMATFLDDLLRWCARASVPVLLMSATLAPHARTRLIDAFTSGLPEAVAGEEIRGYPNVTAITSHAHQSRSTDQYRSDISVEIEVAISEPNDLLPVAERIVYEIRVGGCVLVVLDTVRRAQDLYELMKERGVPARLLHGRLTTASRADLTAELVDVLGQDRDRRTGRPHRLVVVATQIAEQSFDVDADWLVTDIAPMDLLLQRVGRLHRHDRPPGDRPPGMRRPRVLVVGFQSGTVPGPALFAGGPEKVYGRYALLKTAMAIGHGVTWQVPSSVPALVARAYDVDAPSSDDWRAALAEAYRHERPIEEARASRAVTFRLSGEGGALRDDLAGLHKNPVARHGDEVRTVRDGDPTIEVALVLATDGDFFSLDGTPLGPNGEGCGNQKIARRVWGDTVRLPDEPWVRALAPLPGWQGFPAVSTLRTLKLNKDCMASVTGAVVTYDRELGLLIARDGRG